MICFGREVCGTFEDAGSREWLETNGIGGFAMGTISGANTRRPHGLLSFPQRQGPVFQFINRLEESLFFDDSTYTISCQSYSSEVRPEGYVHIEKFCMDPFPKWIYSVGAVKFEKTLFLRYGENTSVVLYRHLEGPAFDLEVSPLLSCRSSSEILREDKRFLKKVFFSPEEVQYKNPPDLSFFITPFLGRFYKESYWCYDQKYLEDAHLGVVGLEDVYSPGIGRYHIKPNQTGGIVFSQKKIRVEDVLNWERQEILFRREISDKFTVKDDGVKQLFISSDNFVYSENDTPFILGGYPQGKNTSHEEIISLPGLLLSTKRFEEAEKVLDRYQGLLKNGLLPTSLTQKSYTAVDLPLWFIWTVQQFYKSSKNDEVLKKYLPTMREIVDSYEHGVYEGIKMDRDGLISIHSQETVSSWQSGRDELKNYAPRMGKAVEVQALWYNALQFLAELEICFNEEPRGYEKLADIAYHSFNEKFWDENNHYLFDHLEGKEKDSHCTAYALFSISLPYEILDQQYFKKVVEVAREKLLRSFGLCLGTKISAISYPWLLAHFVTAFLKASGSSDKTKEDVSHLLSPLREHLFQKGLGSIAGFFKSTEKEIFLGNPMDALSVGEILRVLSDENIQF